MGQARVQVHTGGGLGVNCCDSGCCPVIVVQAFEKRGRKMRRGKGKDWQVLRWSGISLVGALTLSSALLGQASPDSKAAISVPTDWTHQHVIFSQPANAEQARRLRQEPRYLQQLARRSAARVPEAAAVAAAASELRTGSKAPLPSLIQPLERDWSEDLGAGATVGAGNYPAKFSFDLNTANCGTAPQPDFTVYATGLPGSATQANLVAYDNLYTGCGGTVPSVYWAYDTGGPIQTSPVFSLDGTQVAFVISDGPGTGGILMLLKWAPSTTATVGGPVQLTPVLNHLYPACVAPCTTQRTLRDPGGTPDQDTNSSVFYDYGSDTAYVGDDAGYVHKFTPVFNGVLFEIKTGGWPVLVNSGSLTPALTDPVFDPTSGNVFVEDKGGFLYWLNSATPSPVTQSGLLDHSTAKDGGPGFVQGPVIDSTAGVVYAFATSDGSAGCPISVGGSDCSVVYATNTTFTGGDVPSKAIIGTSTAEPAKPSPLYIGGFDSTYKNSVDATGNLYVCGNTGGDPVLYQVAIADGDFVTASAGPVLSTSLTPTPCSPVTDIFNRNASGGATEWIFASADSDGASTPCAGGGCVFNFQDTPWKPSTAYAVGQEVLDSHFQIQVVSVAGTSRATPPTWSTTVDGLTHDGTTLIWVDQGVQSAFTPGSWTANFAFTVGTLIVDSNGNIERCIAAFGPSGGTVPDWATTPGLLTPDFDVVWEELGAPATAAMSAAGGTSGIIIDGIVGSGTLGGASQVYFSILGSQACTGGGTGGCAVQASQSGLQ